MTKSAVSAAAKPVLGEALLHPAAVVAMLLLLLNDHFLKAQHPGTLTGKLSDFAGLAFFPLLLLTLVDAATRIARGRPGLTHRVLVACVVASGLGFGWVKTTSSGAEALRQAGAVLQWPVRVAAAQRWLPMRRVNLVQDATDLAALPALLVAYWAVLSCEPILPKWDCRLIPMLWKTARANLGGWGSSKRIAPMGFRVSLGST